jgi:hypothetical protein
MLFKAHAARSDTTLFYFLDSSTHAYTRTYLHTRDASFIFILLTRTEDHPFHLLLFVQRAQVA